VHINKNIIIINIQVFLRKFKNKNDNEIICSKIFIYVASVPLLVASEASGKF
jgi:hypothetical protein